MRFVAIAFILLSLPVFIALLKQHPGKRDWALFAIGVMMFLVGSLQIDAALVTWRMWQGTSRGIFISPIDTLSLALIFTRLAGRARVHFLWLMILFILPSLMSVFLSPMPMASFFIPTQILRITIMFYALAGELHRISAMRSLFGGIAAGLIIQGGYVANQKLSGVVQAAGTTDHQNILGMMVEMAVIPLMALILEGDRRKLLYAGVIAALVIVAGGGSRATMAFASAGLVLILVLSIIRRPTAWKSKVLGMGVLVALVAVPFGLATLDDRFGDRAMTVEDDVRGAMEEAAIAVSYDHPFGIGANTLVLVANEGGYYRQAGVPWGGTSLTAPVHNSFLLMRAETGWLGEFVLLLVLFVPIVAGLRIAFQQRSLPIAGMGLASVTVAVITALHMNYEYAWHLEAVQRLYFVNLAVLSACIHIVGNEAARLRKARAGRRTPKPQLAKAANSREQA